uniref:Wbp11/ELF5/Saf1 N-terminal domain-containing protein n=1 Tax=Hucho hucho TaxID=62062 RepID=A0A4W5PMI5_9TELE
MGRRSTSSTKSGKFMNPTDQARKEARKRELKKNKKQRMMVRTAVLKMKDPRQIIKDMEKLDEMEFNPVQQPLLNEKVLRDKRKKLRETFERIVRLYERENPDTYKELRKLELDYESNRGKLSLYFDSVKNAELVEVDSIPLPEMPHAPSSILIQDIPLPGAQPPSILKKGSSAVSVSFLWTIPQPYQLLCKLSLLSLSLSLSQPPGMLGGPRGPMPRLLPPGPPPGRPPGPPPGPPPGLPPGPPPRGPPPRLPPPAPPGMRIPPPPRSGPPRQLAPPLSLFPPPLNSNVLSAPPSIVHRQKPGSNPDGMQMPPPPGTSAPPSGANPTSHHHAPTIEKRANITSVSAGGSNLATGPGSGGATISAKPQIINPKTEVTRFVPTALRVRRDKGAGSGGGPMEKRGRREERLGGQKQQSMAAPMGSANPTQMGPVSQPNMKTKDQMYEAFMREMEGLL